MSRASFDIDSLSDSLTARWLMAGLLALLMAVPLRFIQSRIAERDTRAEMVTAGIASSWGGAQQIVGPVLILPYTIESAPTVRDGEETVETTLNRERPQREGLLAVLPDQLTSSFELEPQTRHRALYEVVVFSATGRVRGSYPTPQAPPLPAGAQFSVRWSDAYVIVGIADPTAISSLGPIQVGAARGEFEPRALHEPLTGPGFHAPVALRGPEDLDSVSLDLVLKGSDSLSVAPIGRSSIVELSSTWPHPDFLTSPDKRTIEDSGFSASWSHSHLTQALPAQFDVSEAVNLERTGTGVRLIDPVDKYAQISRATKYGLLFVCMTFLVLLLFELSPGVRLHPVQYALVGVALALFYLTLLSLSEHVRFLAAYVGAGSVVVVMIGSYIWAARRSWLSGALVGAETTTLYGVLYAVLQMEDLALLAGTAVLLFATAAAMFATRGLGRTTH